jgi:drug/metabolite transporter (DMT)-like permease
MYEKGRKSGQYPLSGFANPVIWANLLFLAVLASPSCFNTMFHATKQMSEAIQSSNYLYLNPLFTTIAASLILEEQLTVFAVAGVGLVLGGVYFAARKS